MSQIEFRYTNAQGEASTHRLNDEWEESGKYLTGYSLTEKGPRTFLIYRVTEYLNGSERLLHNPFQAAPEKVTKQAATDTQVGQSLGHGLDDLHAHVGGIRLKRPALRRRESAK